MDLLRILWRLIVMSFAFIFAAIAATAVGAGGFMAIDGPPQVNDAPLEVIGEILLVMLGGASVIGALAGPVAVIVALVGEAFRFRSWLYYAMGGGMAAIGGMAISGFERFNQQHAMAVLAAGLVAGLVYWLIAGRSAGFLSNTPR